MLDTLPILGSSSPSSIDALDKVDDKAAKEAEEKRGEGAARSTFSFFQLEPRRKLIILFLGFAKCCACSFFGLLGPFFPAEAHKKGASQSVVGLVFSCFELIIFLSSPIFGTYMSRIGAKFMFTAGIFVSGSTTILFGLLDKCPAGWVFITLAFLIRSVEALACSAFFTASSAILANTFPAHVATVVGMVETFTGIGLMTGPALGGVLYQLGGFGLPFWLLSGIFLLCGTLSMVFLPSQDVPPRKTGDSVWRLLKSCRSWVVGLVVTCSSFGVTFMSPTLADSLAPYNLEPMYVGFMFLLTPGLYAITAPLWGWVGDTKGLTFSLMIPGMLFAGMGYLALGPSPLLPFLPQALWMIGSSLALIGLFLGCALIPTIKSLLLAACELGFGENLNTCGLVSGLYTSCFSLGAFLGPSCGGFLLEHIGFPWAVTVTAAIFFFGSAVNALYAGLQTGCPCVSGKLRSTKEEEVPLTGDVQANHVTALHCPSD